MTSTIPTGRTASGNSQSGKPIQPEGDDAHPFPDYTIGWQASFIDDPSHLIGPKPGSGNAEPGWTASPYVVADAGTPTTAYATPSMALYLQQPGDAAAISISDIHQGQIGDCFLLASIGAIALLHPTSITDMIHDNSNGTYTVTLYRAANGSLPGYSTTNFMPVGITVDTNFLSSGVNNAPTQGV